MTDDAWQDLVARTEGGPVTRGTMFGSQGLRTGTKFFAIRWHEQLVVKLPPGRLEELVAAGRGQVFEPMAGRTMNGWLLLQGADDPDDLDGLLAEGRAHVEAQQK
jgi:hypothetical protein